MESRLQWGSKAYSLWLEESPTSMPQLEQYITAGTGCGSRDFFQLYTAQGSTGGRTSVGRVGREG